jgi:hypothetical protein
MVCMCALTLLRPAVAAEQWITSKIFAVYPLSNGNFVLIFNDDHPACTSTANPKYYYVSVGQNGITEEGRTALLAVATAAAASKSDVSVAFDDGTDACYVNRIWAELGE